MKQKAYSGYISHKKAEARYSNPGATASASISYPSNRYPLPTTVFMYFSPIFRLIWLTTFATAALQFVTNS